MEAHHGGDRKEFVARQSRKGKTSHQRHIRPLDLSAHWKDGFAYANLIGVFSEAIG